MTSRELLAVMCAMAAPGCFFVQPINGEPQARIEKLSPGPHFRGDTIRFAARKSTDPDDDPLRATWRAFACDADRVSCDVPAFASMADAGTYQNFNIAVPPFRGDGAEVTRAVLVSVTVSDDGGAEQEDRMFVDVLNQEPSLELQVQGFASPTGGGYPIGTPVRVVADGRDPDGDPLDYAWRLYPATGSQPDDAGWQRVDDLTYELEADIIGLWRVEVTAEDGQGGVTTETASILVQEDAPPCIAATEPPAVPGARYIVERDSGRKRFAVLSVRDDLDVYPPPAPEDAPMGSARFRWRVATPDTGGVLTAVSGHELADLAVDASAYAPGDRLAIRVEIDDRVGRELGCDEALATCSLRGDDCLQRVTWEVEVR